MALRNASGDTINRFKGLNSYDHLEDLAPDTWLASLNMSVSAKGSAEVMRSPKGFNTALSTTNPIISMADYENPFEARLLFDINLSSGSHVATYKIENDLSNTSLRTNQSSLPWVSLVVNGQLYRVNKNEFIQHTAPNNTTWFTWDVFVNGITAPAAAPTIAYTGSGGTGQINNGIQVSYAYMNSRTGHVSQPCPISNRLGASAVNDEINVPVVASAQHGVDKLVFFFTLDGGSQPYLLIDSSGDPVTKANTSTTYTFDVGTLAWDTLTPEPIFNYTPPAGASFMFQWKSHILLLGFDGTGTIPATNVVYSGLESCYIGNPSESWPPLNQLSAQTKGELMGGGIATQLGALMFSDKDAYLLAGFPSDKTSGPEASTAVSEVLDPLNWGLGTRSPRTIRNTPFGTMWLDQGLRWQLWNGSGFPDEMGIPLRAELSNLDLTTLNTCEAQWYQFGKDGGVYVMTGKDTVSGKYKLYFLTLFKDPKTGQLLSGYGISDITSNSLIPVLYLGKVLLFMGGTDQVKTIFSPDQAGDGWPGGTSIYFDMVVGNANNYQYFHSISIDGEGLPLDVNGNLTKVTISIRDIVKDANGDTVPEAIGNARTLTLSAADAEDDATAYSLIDEYGRRKVIRFAFDSTVDNLLRQIKNIRVFYSPSKRLI